MKDKGKEKEPKAAPGLLVKNPAAAGVDLGAKEHYVAIGADRVEEGQSCVKCFATHTEGLEELAQWLKSKGIATVAMEATGVYWMGAFEALERHGLEICLVNARHLKGVPGRKSDVQDSQWLQQLHSYGLLRSSVVPQEVVRDLRAYVRQRGSLEAEKSRAMMHLHKALELMNVKVQHVIKNMDSQSGMAMMRAIAQGETDAGKLARLRTRQLRVGQEELEKSLRGNYKAAHVFMLRQALARYDFIQGQMEECERQMEGVFQQMVRCSMGEEELQALAAKVEPRLKVKKNGYRRPMIPYLTQLVGVDLTEIDGLEESTIVDIISEVGLDLASKWPDAQHFTHWLRLAPEKKISGGKVIGHFKSKGASRANQAFRLAAQAVGRTKTGLGAFYRSLRARRGPAIANKATARKIAVIFYMMMTKKEAYRPQSQQEYEAKREARRLRRLEREARLLGYEIKKRIDVSV